MATIKLGMDASEVISKQEQINTNAKKHGEHAKTFGEEMSHAAEHGLGRALIKVIAIREALKSILEASKKISEDTAEADKEAGKRAVQEAGAFKTLGVKNSAGLGEAYRQAEGASSLEERDEFLKKLADYNRTSRVKLSGAQVNQALFAYARGGESVFGAGGEDLIEDLKRHRGIKSQVQIDTELQALPEDVQKELSTRDFERRSELQKETALTGDDRGLTARRSAAILGARRAEQETGRFGLLTEGGRALSQTVLGTDVIGTVESESMQRLGGSQLGGRDVHALLSSIAINTKPAPSLNLTGHSE